MGKRCGNCANSTWLNEIGDVPEICYECENVHGEPSNWKEKNVTNADRIRAMSDDELAEWICKHHDCTAYCPGYTLCVPGDGKSNGLKKWLQQPAEGE